MSKTNVNEAKKLVASKRVQALNAMARWLICQNIAREFYYSGLNEDQLRDFYGYLRAHPSFTDYLPIIKY